ncbi:MAG: 50S ribosomal protein L11 methyltransferase, partial [Acidimicrobiales bacterium]
VALVASRWAPRVIEPDSDAHLDAWRAWAIPRRVGRLLLQPAWLPLDADDPECVVVQVDPGRSFGSGSHASTRLVLAVLQDELRGGERVLDVGCGSGVLAVAACRLGAASAVGIDVDPAAVAATLENAARNGVGAVVAASTTPVGDLRGTFDVVLANIGARVLRELAGPICARVAPGGRLVLAGLLDEQVDGVVAAYTGMRLAEQRTEDGWTAAVLRA